MDKLPPTGSRKPSNSSDAVLRLTEAKAGARRLLGCYRTGDANDPEVYISAVVVVLAQYPPDVIRAVTEPTSGLSSKLNWLPTVREVTQACEEIEGPRRRMREWEASARRQIEARKPLQITDNRPRPTYEELVERCAKDGLFIGPKGVERVSPAKVREKYGISQEAWDAIPNRA